MLNRIFFEGLAPLLEPLGFERTGQTLCKRGAGHVWLVEWLPQGENRFDLGLGVYYPSLMAAARAHPAYARLPKTKHPRWDLCAQATTLSELSGRNWTLSHAGGLKPLIEEVTVQVLEQALPWFAQRRDFKCVLDDEQARFRDVAEELSKAP